MDQVSKYFVISELTYGSTLPLFSGIFHFTLVKNTGIAFGFFREHENALLLLITLSIGVLIFLGYRLCQHQVTITSDGERIKRPVAPSLARVGLALILGGAVGNWIDRIRFGAVIDFLDFRIWPVFNVADSAITVGVCLYLLVFIRKSS